MIKLFNILHMIEIMVVKVTELEAIHLLQYEDTYNQLCRID